MSGKSELHRLVDELPDTEAIPAQRFLEYLRDMHGENDAVLRSLANAPADDEPLTPEDLAAIEEARVAYRRGHYVSADEAKRELLG